MTTQNIDPKKEITIKELVLILWNAKWWLFGLMALVITLSAWILLKLPNQYQAKATLMPAENQAQNLLGSLTSQFGGIASIAGLNLGKGNVSEIDVALELMEDWGFIEKFIEEHQIVIPLMAASGWNKDNNELIINSDVFDLTTKKWKPNAFKGENGQPTSWEQYQRFVKNLQLTKDPESGLVHIKIKHYSPVVASQWVNFLTTTINEHMKKMALKDTTKSIQYLEKQIKSTNISEIRVAFSQLLQEQHKIRMLAEVSDEYAFKVISPPKIATEHVFPKRALMLLILAFLGFIVVSTSILSLHFIRRN